MKNSIVYSNGVSLIEIMVALFLLSLGVLGVTVLHNKSLQMTRDAYYRSQALNLVAELFTRVEMNKQQLNIYNDKNNWLVGVNQFDLSCIGGQVECNPVQLAKFDINQLRVRAKKLLPNGHISLYQCELGEASRVYCLLVTWLSKQMSFNCKPVESCVEARVVF